MDIIVKITVSILIGIIKSYQIVISPFLTGSCRHMPTCSQYAIDAIVQFGPIKGLYLSINRLLRCSPYGTSGYDPVPDKEERQ